MASSQRSVSPRAPFRTILRLAAAAWLFAWAAPEIRAQERAPDGNGPATPVAAAFWSPPPTQSAGAWTLAGPAWTREPVLGSTTAVRQGGTNGTRTPSIYDRIWRFAEWYRDDSNPIVQRVQFSGRYQHDFALLDADEGELDEWNVRRMRLGPRITLFRTFTVHTEVELNPQERDPLYVRLTDAYVQWARTPRVAVTVGKQGVPFTMDGGTSSKDLLTIDRSNLANNLWFPQEYMPGASVSGRVNAWTYRGGLYSSGRSNRELGEFSGGLFTLGSVGYDLGRTLGVKEAIVTGSYVYQDPDTDNTFTRQMEHIASVTLKMEASRWGMRGDVSGGKGYLGQSDVWGIMAMPFANLTSRLQVVGRYTFLESAQPNGVQLATYENRVVRGRGDEYHELYAGANYYLYGHKLKLQTGVQFGDLNDRAGDGGSYSGTSWTSGLRISW